MAQDPLGLVYNKTEGSGAAQIFGPSEAVKNLRDFGQQKFAADDAARKKALDAVKPKPQKLTEFGQPWRIDQKYISDALGLFTKGATQKINAGIDLSTDKEYLDSVNLIKTAIEGSTQQQKLYDDLTKSVINAPDKFDVDATLAQLKEWEQIPLMQRLSTPMPDPIYKSKEEEPFDFMNPLKNIDIGYLETRDWTDRESGTESKRVKTDALMGQSKQFIDADPKYYKKGLDMGLWTSKEDAAKWVYQQKLWSADTYTKDILRNEPKNNQFGTGKSEQEVNSSYEKWRTDLFNGSDEAMAFVMNTSMPDGRVLNKFGGYGGYDLTDPTQLKEALPYMKNTFGELGGQISNPSVNIVDPIRKQYFKNPYAENNISFFKLSATGKPAWQTDRETGEKTKVEDVVEFDFIPQSIPDEELKKMYIQGIKNGNTIYGYDFATTASGGVRTTGKTQDQEKTFKRSDLKQYIKDGYTEDELIKYYQGLGYKMID